MTSAAVICSVAPIGAHAQPAAAAAPSSGTAVQEIVVTGTRIASPNLQSISPVQVVTSQDIATGGRVQTIDILNQLPQASFAVGVDFGPTSDALSNPGGSATVDLRGIGPQRTLVLVDGKRLGIGDPNTGNPNPAPDINQIPSALVDRIEVLTGGASATYGSDAVAGVVNFIMKKNFEGVQLDAQWGVNQHGQQNGFMQGLERKFGTPVPGSKWDGYSGDYSLTLGMNSADGKGNVTGYATYFSQDPVFQGARDYSACQLKSTKVCTGSSNSNTVYLSSGDGDQLTVVGNQFLLYPQANSNPPPLFNSNPYESLIHKDTRYTGGFLANYDYNDWFKPYLTFQFMHDQTDTQVAPGALFQGTGSQPDGGYLVNCNNPLLSAPEAGAIGCTAAQIGSTVFNSDPNNPVNKDLYFGRRNVEGGPRQFSYDHDNFRVVLGSKGKLWGPFSYDLYGSYYDTRVAIDNENFQSIAAVQNAFLVKGTAANPVCISGGACVPYNIFKDGGVTPAQTAYLAEAGTSRGSTTEAIVEGTVTGNLGEYGVKSPWAAEGVGVAAGFQVRRDTLTYKPDQAELSNDMSGFGGAAVSINNALGVTEGFGEVRVPLVQDKDWFHDLSLNAGYRYSAYSTGANARTFKGGGEWAPTADFRFRGGFNRAVRAPSIIELYTPQSVTNTSVVSEDPCAANAAHPASLAACQNTRVTAANYGKIPQCPANQCAVIQGGNTDLQPETADTYTLGGVFTPRFIPGFQASIDYYHIDLQGIISNVPLGVSLSNCLAGVKTYCTNIVRNPVNGILFGNTVGAGGYFVGTNINVASEVVQGLDVQASYRLPLSRFGHDDWGTVNFALNGSVDMGWQVTPLPAAQTYDCNGLFGPQCQGVFPKWRHTLRATWNAPHNVQASVAWRYYGGATYEADTNQPTIGGNTTPDPIAHTIPAVNYMDVAVSWQVRRGLTLRAGVNNILDQDPPLIENSIVGNANPNSYPVYDLLGRHLFLSLSAKF
ncbi:MAG: TonB-dependent receptor plug domain-containing protein [Caulobacteraceae bacterium]